MARVKVVAKYLSSEILISNKTKEPYQINKFQCDEEASYISTFGDLPMQFVLNDLVEIEFKAQWKNNSLYPAVYTKLV